MKPAYHIPLSETQLRMLGEICSIQGQVESLMRDIVAELLRSRGLPISLILGSAGIRANAVVWIEIIRARCKDRRILKKAERAFRDIQDLAAGRNDFIHAIYTTELTIGPPEELIKVHWYGREAPPGKNKKALAIRLRGGKQVSPRLIRSVRNKAAKLSLLLLDIQVSLLRAHASRTARTITG